MVRRVTGKSVVEVEPNDLARPQELSEHTTISGRIDPPGERDVFGIALKKGEKRVFALESRTFGLPLDAVLQSAGRHWQDPGRDRRRRQIDSIPSSRSQPPLTASIVWSSAISMVEEDHTTRISSVIAPKPDFTLTLPADKFDVTSGKPANVVVNIIRANGFSGTIDVMAEDLPDCAVATTARSKASDASAKSVTLVIRAMAVPTRGRFVLSEDRPTESRVRVTPLRRIPEFETSTDHPWLTVVSPVKPKKP